MALTIGIVGRFFKKLGNYLMKEDYNRLMIRELEQYRRIENIKEPLFFDKKKNKRS